MSNLHSESEESHFEYTKLTYVLRKSHSVHHNHNRDQVKVYESGNIE